MRDYRRQPGGVADVEGPTLEVLSHYPPSATTTVGAHREYLFEDLGEGGGVDVDELLQFVQITDELLEAFLEGNEAGRQFGLRYASGLDNAFLVQKSLESELELCFFLQVESVDLLKFSLLLS